jgi:sulfite exporter TauE/SafE
MIEGLLFGLISTLHCAGMCGPLALYAHKQFSNMPILSNVLYQFGRVLIYVLIGQLVYLIGLSFSVFKWQQYVSIGFGAVLLLYTLGIYWFKWEWLNGKANRFNQWLQQLILKSGRSSAFAMGLVNGLLPCGAVYIAATFCVSFESPLEAANYMLFFGLGTLPVFIAVWRLLSNAFQFKLKPLVKWYKVLPVLVAILMILRGANLGIPYLSPEITHSEHTVKVKNCCK